MAVTIKELAKFCGLSPGTVSRALNNHPAVSPDTVAYIKSTAKKLGYMPSNAGRALSAQKRPQRLGVLLPSINNPFFEDIKRGLLRGIDEYKSLGLHLSLEEVEGWDPEVHLKAIARLEQQQCDAYCLCSLSHPLILNKAAELKEHALLCCINHTLTGGVSPHFFVGVDFYKSGFLAANVAKIRFGSAPIRLLIVIGLKDLLGHEQRQQGFAAGLSHFKTNYKFCCIAEGRDNEEETRLQTRLALERNPEVNCIYVATGSGFAGSCRAVSECAQDRELFIIGTDDPEPALPYLQQGLVAATICQEPKLQGFELVRKVYRQLSSKGLSTESDLIVEPRLKLSTNFLSGIGQDS